MDGTIGFALLLSTLAGMSTTLGSLLGVVVRKPGPRLLTLTLGFSGGVMIHVAYVELLQSGIDAVGFGPAHVAFFGGIVAMFIIDATVPHYFMAERHLVENTGQNAQLFRAGLFVALGVGIHNFPEGMASFVGALQERSLGVAIAAAIALHNIPEGLAIAAPVYASTGSRSKAVLWSFLGGMTEPLGAALTALLLLPSLDQRLLNYVLSAVAGIMVFISVDELVPVCRSFGEEHLSIVGIVAGMVIMTLGLWILS
jgi:ZIP family zinc transporter